MIFRTIAATVSTIATIGAAGAFSSSFANEAEEFYRNKTLTMVVAFSAGGMYGLNGRIMSRHLGKHIPGNPNIVVQHMPGQGGAKAANYMYNAAPQDGSYIAELSKDIAVAQKLRPEASKYKADEFHFLGRMNPYSAVFMVWHAAGVKTLEDAKENEVIVANSGKSSHSYMEAALLKKYAGLNLRLVVGYAGAGEMYQAMENGEAHARIGAWNSLKSVKRAWLRDNKVYVIMQTGLEKQPDLPDTPLMVDLFKDEEPRRMAEFMSLGGPVGWGLSAPPGTPKHLVAALQGAFDEMVKDPAFLEDAKKRNAEVNPATGKEVQKAVERTLAVPDSLVAQMREIAGF